MSRGKAYRALTLWTIALTVALIAVGSLVRTTGSGLGCPDWPLCHGGVVPIRDQAAVIEWSHRLLAAVTGLFILVEVAWTAARHRLRAPTWVGVLLLALLAVQAYLGRETVHRELPPALVATHLANALAILALLVGLACVASLPGEARVALPAGVRRSVAAATALTAVAVLLGAYLVAAGASLACTTWPGCAESPVPWWQGGRLQDIHWLHRVAVGLALGAVVVQFAWLLRQRRRGAGGEHLLRLSATVLVLFLLQVLVGAFNIWLRIPEALRVLHLLVASATWAALVALFLAAATPWSVRRSAPAR